MDPTTMHAPGVDWTQVLLALVSVVGTLGTAVIATLATRRTGQDVRVTAAHREFVEQSLRPPPESMPPTIRTRDTVRDLKR